MHLFTELPAASWMLKPFGEVGANSTQHISSETHFPEINKEKVSPKFNVKNIKMKFNGD